MTLVVGFDNTGAARQALRTALELSDALGESVYAVYGVRPPGNMGEEYSAAEAAIAELGQDALNQAQDIAAEVGTTIEIVLVDASPEDALIQVADLHDARMIVVGAYGPGTLRAALLGSTARNVLLRTLRPVLIVQDPDDGTS